MEDRKGLHVFYGIAAGLFVIRVIAALVRVPESVQTPVNLLLTVIFVSAPIIALFSAASLKWHVKPSLLFVCVGVAMHVGGLVIAKRMDSAFWIAQFDAAAQTGLLIWCLGLGSLVAQAIKDKNLLLPIAIFLAGFDAFLILTPTSLPRQIMATRPEVFEAVAAKVPGVGVGSLAHVGPADFFFLAMFFVAVHHFKMRTRATLFGLIGALVLYLALVVFFGSISLGPVSLSALPALVPIGIVVLVANWGEFQMKGEEKLATAIVAVVAVGLGMLGYRNAMNAKKAPPAAPSTTVPGLAIPESAGSPG